VLQLALSNGEAILLIVLAAIPIGALTFALGAGGAYRQIGKGQFAVEFEHDLPQSTDAEETASAEIREAEVRQMLEAKAYRQQTRGEQPLNVDAELERILAEDAPGGDLASNSQLREEVRQLVVARNERRARKGEEPLDVEAEVDRQLRELENLGQ
jgi:nucleotidyltransferase/DNA polymerase involved in DNA repair